MNKVVFSLILLVVPSALAEDLACVFAIKKCVLKNQDERQACLSKINNQEKNCENSPSYELVASRYSLKESKNPIAIESVDHTCINSFDISLSTILAKDSMLPSEIAELKNQLESCTQKASINLFRP